jgi:hypothetical protein
VNIQYHRPTKRGPEEMIMEAIFRWSRTFDESKPYWVASSIPIGAGAPDVILATYRPEITRLVQSTDDHVRVLAYLRLVRSAPGRTIATRIGRSHNRIDNALGTLQEAGAIERKDDKFQLSKGWKQILPKTIAIEAKVADWRKAIEQASRNSIFVHQSYVALPESLSSRILADPRIEPLRLGIMTITKNGNLEVVRQAPRSNPIAWYYYYSLALTLSRTDERRRCPSVSPSTKPEDTSLLTSS